MQKMYKNKASVFNKGNSRYDTVMVKQILPNLIANNKNIAYCTLLLGSNDCFHRISPAVYKQNMLWIIDYIRKPNPNIPILLCTPPTIFYKYTNGKPYYDIKPYVDIVKQLLSERPSLYLVDMFAIIKASDLNEDQIHFNVSGSNKMFAAIQQTLTNKCPNLLPNKI